MKRSIITLLCLLAIQMAYGQIEYPLNIKVSLSKYSFGADFRFDNRKYNGGDFNQYRLELGSVRYKGLLLNAYFSINEMQLNPKMPPGEAFNVNIFGYGIGMNYIIVEFKKLPVIYLRGELGAEDINSFPDYTPETGIHFRRAIGAGISCRPFRRLGMYSEYTLGSHTNFRFGLSYNFFISDD
jgi:hypothetical protein